MIVLGLMIIKHNITCQNLNIRFTSYSNLDNLLGLRTEGVLMREREGFSKVRISS